MAKKLSTEDKISALSRLSFKDKFVLIVVAAAIVIGGFMFLFKLATGQYDSANIRFPDSTLAPSPVYQTYQFKQAENLTVPISFPSIPYGMFVAGEEANIAEDGCSFAYADAVSIVVCEVDENLDTSSVIEQKLYRYLYGNDASTRVKYKTAVQDVGFMNGLYAAYECGTYTVAGLERYLLSYRYFTGEGKDILFMVVTENRDWLLNMKTLLDTMFYSMYTFDPEEGSAVILQNTEKESLLENNEVEEEIQKPEEEDAPDDVASSGTYVEYEGPISDHAKEQLEKLRAMREEKTKNGEEGYLDGYGENEFYASFDYEDTLEDAYFIFHYAEVQKTPSYAYLYDPDGNQYSAASINATLTGDILFEVKHPIAGQWNFVIEDKDGLGNCTLDAMEKTAYEALQAPFDENERSAPPVD